MNNRKLAVSTRSELDGAMLILGNHRLTSNASRDQAFSAYDALTQSGAAIRHFGATALDLANVAAGRVDVCCDYTMQPWDIAAGLLLVQEAGGIITECDGKPANAYAKTLIAANKSLHAPIQKILVKTE